MKGRVARAIKILLSKALPEEASIKAQYLMHFGRPLDLVAPETFTEKIQCYKLFVRDPRMMGMVDKIAAKAFVAGELGDEWIIPTLWHGGELPSLPDRDWPIPFVLKASHGCSWNIFVRSADDVDWDPIERATGRWLSQRYGVESGQWAYGGLAPRILVEPYIGPTDSLPVDYKFWVFSGEVCCIQVDIDREQQHRRAFFDRQWQRQPFTTAYPIFEGEIRPPRTLQAMIEAAEELARPFSFVRVDFYEVEGRPKFGEMTFYPGSGFSRFQPSQYDRELGRLFRLSPAPTTDRAGAPTRNGGP